MDAIRAELDSFQTGFSADDDPAPSRQTIALAWSAARRARDRVFTSPLFHNPAWDILLELYIQRHAGETCVFQVCAGSSSPPTTVLRWIGVLEAERLIERHRDKKDRRRSILSLTPLGLSKMEEALDAATESDKRLGLGRLRLVE